MLALSGEKAYRVFHARRSLDFARLGAVEGADVEPALAGAEPDERDGVAVRERAPSRPRDP
jgi:hypothetical protein